MTQYSLNPNEAKEGSGRISNRIDEKGAYVGTFTKAKAFKNANGTSGVEFEFVTSTDKKEARLTIYTHNGKGEALHGFKQLQAIMAVLKLRDISTQVVNIEEWDHAAGQKVRRDAELFPMLMGKPIGVVIVMEPYQGAKGIGSQPIFHAPYDPATSQLAIEILERKPAESLKKMLAGLKDRPMRIPAAKPAAQGSGYSAPDQNDQSFLDDIPF
jgi:hypothetical protein